MEKWLKIYQHTVIMSFFNYRINNPQSVAQETQQKTFVFVKSSKGEINFRAPQYGESDGKKAGTWWIPTLRPVKNPLKH